MKELKIKRIYNAEYDININSFLSISQIEKIAEEVIKLDTYAEREQMICYMVLNYCTDIDRETLDNSDPEIVVASGLWELVRGTIYNFYLLDSAIEYYESPVRLLANVAEILPDLISQLNEIDIKKVIKHGVQ